MSDLTKRKIDSDLAVEQSCPKKTTLIRPLPLRASAKVPIGAGSAFKPWQKPSNGPGIAKESSTTTKPCNKVATSANSAPAEKDNDQNTENSTPDHLAEKNPTNGSGATSGAANDNNTDKTDDAPEEKHGSGSNTKLEMDPRKLKRLEANRLSSQRCRLKKDAHIADLERQAEFYKDKIDLLYPQLVAQKTQLQSLQIEQHTLKLHIAAREEQRIFQEAAIESNKAEMDRLMKLQMKLAEEAKARMHDEVATLQLIRSNLNLNPPGLGPLDCKNSIEALYGVETSKALVDTAQQPQNQSQMRIGLTSIPDLNLVRPEPES